MTTNNLQTSPYLPRQRNFPKEDISELSAVIDKVYIEIASKVNSRTISTFANNFQIITGEQWFLTGQPQKQQSLRQVYPFGAIAPGTILTIPTQINNISQFSRIYGTCITTEAGPSIGYRPIPATSIVANANIELRLQVIAGFVNIIIASGAAMVPIISGIIILEWISISATNS